MNPDAPTPDASVAVVIVNYRTADLTVDCLASLEPEARAFAGRLSVVVTDNDSGDGSAEHIASAVDKHGWSDWCTVMPLPKNGGFAYGNNRGIEAVLAQDPAPDFVLLLNPDTVVRPAAVSELVRYLQDNPAYGLAGSRLEDPDATPQRSAFRFIGVLSELEAGLRIGLASRLLSKWIVAPPVRDDAHPVDWVAGASLLVRRAVFGSVGLLDEGYFMYFEEVDFCLRARRAGYACGYAPQSRVVHLVGQASGVTDTKKPPKRRPAYWFESRRRYLLKCFGPVRAALADALHIGAFATWRLRVRLGLSHDPDPPRLLPDLAAHSVFARGFRPPESRPPS
ncbi:MAG: glycosyltransferase family 2 protein [Planctomycetota bacterium]